jgi:hypothetical protein
LMPAIRMRITLLPYQRYRLDKMRAMEGLPGRVGGRSLVPSVHGRTSGTSQILLRKYRDWTPSQAVALINRVMSAITTNRAYSRTSEYFREAQPRHSPAVIRLLKSLGR